MLADILDERDIISGTDQGRSFQAFFDFLMSPERQEELSEHLGKVADLPALIPLSPDHRLVDMLRLFLPDTSNEARLIDQVDMHIKKIV